MKNNILVVDDEKEIRDLLEVNLKNEGYNVIQAENGEEALEILKDKTIHLIVLDVMMPKMNGIEFCRKAREKYNMPILMLSAKVEDMDRIQGIMTGADDYLCKPFNHLELSVRIRSLIRRTYYLNKGIENNDNVVKIDSMVIDKNNHKVTIGENEIKLTAREFDILYLLSTNKGKVFSGEEIFEKVWKERYFQSNNTVMVHMSRIRDKLEKYSEGNKIIHTVWGVGYKIEK